MFYEVVYIVRQEASASHVEAVTNEIAELIKSHGGEIAKTEFCGLRTLAYPIKKSRKGYYVLLNISLPAENIGELERLFRLHEDVIRSLIVKVDELDNRPSALMRREVNKPARGE